MELLEQILVNHCGPVLLHKKPAAIISIPRDKTPDFAQLILGLHSGIQVIILCRRSQQDLVMVYRAPLLEDALHRDVVSDTLARWGYPVEQDARAMIACLRKRFGEAEEFPHEVGFFLGYPVDDVLGFINHKGRNFKHSGPWKVYGDVAYAKSLFAEYQRCREWLQRFVANGGSLHQIAIA